VRYTCWVRTRVCGVESRVALEEDIRPDTAGRVVAVLGAVGWRVALEFVVAKVRGSRVSEHGAGSVDKGPGVACRSLGVKGSLLEKLVTQEGDICVGRDGRSETSGLRSTGGIDIYGNFIAGMELMTVAIAMSVSGVCKRGMGMSRPGRLGVRTAAPELT